MQIKSSSSTKFALLGIKFNLSGTLLTTHRISFWNATLSANIRTPSLTVFLAPKYREDAEAAKEVQTELEYTTLSKVASLSEIYYDPDPKDTVVEEDREFVRDYYAMPDEGLDVDDETGLANRDGVFEVEPDIEGANLAAVVREIVAQVSLSA